jgi:hypothetical protein
MELLAILFIWPFLILAFGLVFITFNDLSSGGFWFIILGLLFIAGMLVRERNKETQSGPVSPAQQLATLRRLVITFSIALLIPVFTRYLFETFDKSLFVIIIGLILAFGVTIWGMFIKSNQVLLYSNIIGGALTLVYVYSQLWELGGGARVIAAAFGLIVAVLISVIKLKDKLA